MTDLRQEGVNPALIFDLDGTLVDTAPDLLASLNHVFSTITDAKLELTHVRQMIGQGARVLICEGLEQLSMTRSEEEIDGLLEIFLKHYFANVANDSKLFDGLDTLLPRYRREGYPLGVCTNKLEAPSRKLLMALGVHDHFHSIIGRDTTHIQKPDPHPLLQTIAEAGGRKDHAIFVGDSITDVKTAKAAGVPCVLVSFGYTPVPVNELGGDVVIDHFDELDAAIKSLISL